MNIVELSISDIDKILELYSKNFSDGWSKKMLESAFNTNRFIALGIGQEKLIGIITCSLTEFDADIESIVIDKEFRKQGLAKLILEKLEERLKSKKIEKIFLEVREGNIPAKNFYIKNGFSKINLRKSYYDDGENAVIMAKEI